jgi:hypothetical protein
MLIYQQDCLALFYDELANFVANSNNMKLIRWIHEELASKFQDMFLCDAEDYKEFARQDPHVLTPSAEFGLDDDVS